MEAQLVLILPVPASSAPKMTHVTRWSSSDVADWLEQCLHLPGDGFRQAEIDGITLLQLDDQQLSSLGLQDAQIARLQSHVSAFHACKARQKRNPSNPFPHQEAHKAQARLFEAPDSEAKVRSSSLGSQTREPRPREAREARAPSPPCAAHELMEFTRQIRQIEVEKEMAKILQASRSSRSSRKPKRTPRASKPQCPQEKKELVDLVDETPSLPIPQIPDFSKVPRERGTPRVERMPCFVPLKRGQEWHNKFHVKSRPSSTPSRSSRPTLPIRPPSTPAQRAATLRAMAQEAASFPKHPEDVERLERQEKAWNQEELTELIPMALKLVEAAMGRHSELPVESPGNLNDPKDAFKVLAELSQGLDGSELQIAQEDAEESWRRPSTAQLEGLPVSEAQDETRTETFGTTTVTPTSVSMSPGRVSSWARIGGALKECSSSADSSAGCHRPASEQAVTSRKSHGSQSVPKGFRFSKVARKEVRSVSPCTGDYTPRFRHHIPGGTFPTASRWPDVENKATTCTHMHAMKPPHALYFVIVTSLCTCLICPRCWCMNVWSVLISHNLGDLVGCFLQLGTSKYPTLGRHETCFPWGGESESWTHG